MVSLEYTKLCFRTPSPEELTIRAGGRQRSRDGKEEQAEELHTGY